jgi:hypothetical protein
MRHGRSEQGSALIMLLGVAGVLVILATAMVMLITNVQFGTGKDRQRAKAFNVAEAGLDLGEQKLDQAWPAIESTTVTPITTADLLALKDPETGQTFLNDTEYPDLSGKVTFFDNDDPTDGQIYIRSVARIGTKTAAIQALVSKQQLPVNLPPDVVLYTEGHLEIQGVGSQDAVGVDYPGSATAYFDPTSVDIKGNADPVDDGNTHPADSRTTSLQSVFPALADLMEEADRAGRSFANEAAFDAHAGQVGGITYEGWSLVSRSQPHIVVIEDGDITLPDTTPGHDLYPSIWTEEEPGILIVPNGRVWIKGQSTFYGLIFCQDVFEGGGTPAIHGVVIAPGGARLHGDRALNYNSKVVFNLDRLLIDAVRVVPGTWRELRGVQAPVS